MVVVPLFHPADHPGRPMQNWPRRQGDQTQNRPAAQARPGQAKQLRGR